MQSRLILLFLVGAMYSSCQKSTCDETFDETHFQVGKDYCISETEFFRIQSINDSRCPLDVVCVHAGFVDVAMSFVQEDVAIIDTMRILNKSESQIFTGLGFRNLVFNVIDVTPENKATEVINQNDYRLVMKIKRD
jgi:hypothetical protein